MSEPPMEPFFPDAPALAASGTATPGPATPGPATPLPDSTPVFIKRRSRGNSALPWLIAAVVVLLLAATAGLISAWVVAGMRAVPPPAVADATPTPAPSASPAGTASPGAPTETPTEQPRRTPTASPEITPEPEPFVHVVQRGETLTEIADFYGVELADIIALNGIRNPDNIQVGRELLIPGYGVRPSSPPG